MVLRSVNRNSSHDVALLFPIFFFFFIQNVSLTSTLILTRYYGALNSVRLCQFVNVFIQIVGRFY